MKRIMSRMQSDKAASNTVETIILIALAIFAALALFTGILNPVRGNADALGNGLTTWFTDLMDSANTRNAVDVEFKWVPEALSGGTGS